MPVYTETKTYHTKAHMGMIDVTDDFRAAVQNACRKTGMKSGTITGFTTGGVAGLTTLEFEPGMVYHDLKAAMDVFSPYRDEQGNVIYYHHHDTWHDDNGSSHIKAALLSPFIVIPFVNGEITIGHVAESDPCGVRYPQPCAGYCLSGDGRIIQIENGKWRMGNAFRSPFLVQKNKKTPVKAVD